GGGPTVLRRGRVHDSVEQRGGGRMVGVVAHVLNDDAGDNVRGRGHGGRGGRGPADLGGRGEGGQGRGQSGQDGQCAEACLPTRVRRKLSAHTIFHEGSQRRPGGNEIQRPVIGRVR